MTPEDPRTLLAAYEEIVASYAASVRSHSRGALVVAALATTLTIVAFAWRGPARFAPKFRALALGFTALLGVGHAWKLAWISDDACISLRYATHFAHGQGLVWNPGERVEGYTDFLWTVVLGLGIRAGIDGEALSVILGLISFAAVLLMTPRLLPVEERHAAIVPVASVLMASSYIAACFGTSGLETMTASALITLALERCLHRAPLQAGIAGVLAALCHPDHLILYVALGAILALDPIRRRELIRYGAPFVGLFIPWFLWRWGYYGQLAPNTYYAKSGGAAYFSQGSVYLLVSVLGTGIWGAIPLAILGLYKTPTRFTTRYTLLGGGLYTLYVMKIGGDFMIGRLLITMLPLLFTAAQIGLREILHRRRWALSWAAIPLMAVMLPMTLLKPFEKRWEVADERTFYNDPGKDRLHARAGYVKWGQSLQHALGSLRPIPTLAIQSVGMVGLYSSFPILDILGLNTPEVAHLPIARRGRPGHEKKASPGFLLDRHVALAELELYPPPYDEITRVHVGPALLRLPRHTPEVVRLLQREPGHRLVDAQKKLDDYQPPPADPDRAACDLWFWDTYFLEPHADTNRYKTLVNKLSKASYLDPEAEQFLTHRSSWKATPLFTFDALESDDWVRTGDAFLESPVFTSPAGQAAPSGVRRGYLDSFHSQSLDGATGKLLSPAFTIEGDVIELKIGGGNSPEVGVALVVDGERVKRATGCLSEIVGARAWGVSKYKGKSANLEIYDLSPKGWAHVVVDEVVQWSAP